MGRRILTTYASRAGSTAEIAEAIAESLKQGGLEVDVKPVERVQRLDGYNGIVLGSAVRSEQWLPEALHFVERQAEVLRSIPSAFFCVGLTLAQEGNQTRENVLPYLDSARRYVEPDLIGFFAGVFDPRRVTLIERLQMQRAGAPVGDFRDWESISAWAEEALALFTQRG